MLTTTAPKGLSELEPVTSDSLLALIALANADSRPEKIDVGVGVYRDGLGRTPVMRALKEAERRLWEAQSSKAYLGGAGDKVFPELLKPILLGPHASDERITGLQTPGGCGAIYLAMQLVRTANPQARVFAGVPTWPNHPPMIRGAGLEIVEYPHLDRGTGSVRIDALLAKLDEARPGDVVLLHGCCHNPTGADLGPDEWDRVAEVIASRGLLPLIDIAYQGLGRGLEEDAYGLRRVLDASDEALVAQSCDKNFGVYRDRVGCLFVKTRSKEATATAMAHLLQLAREAWSMPPDHGAAAVRLVLEDDTLTADWKAELDGMRLRIAAVRERIAASDERLAFVADQYGMFSMLPLSKEQVVSLREKHAIYMADSGRINVVGIADDGIDRFCAAVKEALNGPDAHG
ncbi:MAG: Aspartate aminotransferase [uncultured Sphingomonas sp.]|uniref:Aspartate aminotransferase n=1 Tax=uncultured Sphingomonas sp. TaxID=158754 RepID=A0A6J4TTX6_9SPHN|nr:MAG: Aspartate aminotransferase [uncultured Sphingomonas sp.]